MALLEENLEALRSVSAALAARVGATAVPEGFVRAQGSDGSATFCRSNVTAEGGRRLEWLGGTSMPGASSRPMVKSLDAHAGGANGLGLSIGSGYEWPAFLEKLSRSQMLFVYEPEVGLLRMALEICDLAGQIRSRRMVLLSGTAEEAGEELAAFLAANVGFEPPTVLHPLPTLVGARKNEMFAAGESVVRRGVMERQGLVTRLHQTVTEFAARPAAATEKPVALLVTPRYDAERPLHHEAKNGAVVTVDQYATASMALRLQVFAEVFSSGHVPAVRSDLFRVQLAAVPLEIAIETWMPSLAGPATWERVPAMSTFGPRDRIVVNGGHHVDLLMACGIPAERIVVRPVCPLHAAAPVATSAAKRRVAMIADLPPSDGESLGVVLPTHQAVFAAAREMIQNDFLTLHPGMAGDILRRAMTRAGVDPKADDPALKGPMLRIIRDVLIPALPVLTLAGKLVDQAVPLTLIGDWPGLEEKVSRALSVRLVPFGAYTLGTWEDVAMLAHLSPTGVVSPLLWDAVVTSTAIIAPRHASDGFAGSIGKLLKPEEQFAHVQPQAYIASVKSLLTDATRRQTIGRTAYASIH